MPFHRFNVLSSRLTQSAAHLYRLYPISPIPLNNVVAPKIIYDTAKTQPAKISQQNVAQMSTLSPEVAAKRAFLLKNLDEPVYLKGGARDKYVFYFVCAAVGVGMLDSFHTLYKFASLK